MDPALIQTAIDEKYFNSPYGVDCVFVAITDKWAIKLYKSRDMISMGMGIRIT